MDSYNFVIHSSRSTDTNLNMIGRGILEAVMVHVQTLLSCKAGSFAILLSLLVTLFIAARVILCVLNFIYVYFNRPGKNLRKFGRYAIVTGATDGIGLAYAFELAATGGFLAGSCFYMY